MTVLPRIFNQMLVLVLLSALAACNVESPTMEFTPALAGKITNASTGQANSGATVKVQGKTATTSGTGEYFVDSLKNETPNVEITHGDYVTATRNVVR